jgi:hypothetical protein
VTADGILVYALSPNNVFVGECGYDREGSISVVEVEVIVLMEAGTVSESSRG